MLVARRLAIRPKLDLRGQPIFMRWLPGKVLQPLTCNDRPRITPHFSLAQRNALDRAATFPEVARRGGPLLDIGLASIQIITPELLQNRLGPHSA